MPAAFALISQSAISIAEIADIVTTTPVGALVEKLPDIFDAMRVAANQLRTEMIPQIGRNGQFATV